MSARAESTIIDHNIFSASSSTSSSSSSSSTSSSSVAMPLSSFSTSRARRLLVGSLSTPLPLLQTNFGQPHHLLADALTSLPRSSHVTTAAVRYPHLWNHDMIVARTGRNLQEYLHLDTLSTILLLRDPARVDKIEANEKGLNVETWYGRRRVNGADYLQALQNLQPSYAVTFADEIFQDAGNNRTRSSLERTLTGLKESIAWHRAQAGNATTTTTTAVDGSSSTGRNMKNIPTLLAFIPCVRDAEARDRTLEKILELVTEANSNGNQNNDSNSSNSNSSNSNSNSNASSVLQQQQRQTTSNMFAGYVLGGLGLGETLEERSSILDSVIAKLPSEGLRLLTCSQAGAPIEALQAISQGIDIIDSDYPQILTNVGYAAAFRYDMLKEEEQEQERMQSNSAASSNSSAVTALKGAWEDDEQGEPPSSASKPHLGLGAPAAGGGRKRTAVVAGITETNNNKTTSKTTTTTTTTTTHTNDSYDIEKHPTESANKTTATTTAATVADVDIGRSSSSRKTGGGGGGGGASFVPRVGPAPLKGFSSKSDAAAAVAATSAAFAASLHADKTMLNLNDKKYAGDERPLVPGCRCFACAGLEGDRGTREVAATKDGRIPIHPGHMRAYIHHLQNAREMTGTVLLSVHNTYHYASFFNAIRAAIDAGRFTEYKEWFMKVNGY